MTDDPIGVPKCDEVSWWSVRTVYVRCCLGVELVAAPRDADYPKGTNDLCGYVAGDVTSWEMVC